MNLARLHGAGSVLGKTHGAPSVVAASIVMRSTGQEGDILRLVLSDSIALACLVEIFVSLHACVFPFTLIVIHP